MGWYVFTVESNGQVKAPEEEGAGHFGNGDKGRGMSHADSIHAGAK